MRRPAKAVLRSLGLGPYVSGVTDVYARTFDREKQSSQSRPKHADTQQVGRNRRGPSAPQAGPRIAPWRGEIGAPPVSSVVQGLPAPPQGAVAQPAHGPEATVRSMGRAKARLGRHATRRTAARRDLTAASRDFMSRRPFADRGGSLAKVVKQGKSKGLPVFRQQNLAYSRTHTIDVFGGLAARMASDMKFPKPLTVNGLPHPVTKSRQRRHTRRVFQIEQWAGK
jgi:hypothetical protein